jgi:outer membrane lipoprotein-sorting protein
MRRLKFGAVLLAAWAIGSPLAQAQPVPPAPLSAADQAVVSQAETFLNNQKAITANFLQVAADGSTRTGKAWLERPGKMRFEYDPPDKQLLVAGYGLLVYVDPDLNQTTNIPLGSTPLGILLDKHVDLSGGMLSSPEFCNNPARTTSHWSARARRPKAA